MYPICVADIDECAAEGHEDLCTAEGQQCENTPGAYICTCQPGYVKDGLGACKVQPEGRDSSEINFIGGRWRERVSLLVA